MPTTIDSTGRPAYMYDESTSTWYEISGKVSTGANYQWTGTHQFDNNVVIKGALTAALNFNSFLNPAARTAALSASGSLVVGLLTFIRQDSVGNTVNKFQYWSGSTWIDVGSTVYQATAPSNPTAGNIWINSNTNVLYFWTGSAWIENISATATQSLTNKTLVSASVVTPIINSASANFGTFNFPTLNNANIRVAISSTSISYTLATDLSDASKMIEMGSGSSLTLTIPADGTANYAIGTQIAIVQTGAGQVTVAGAGGVTVNGTPGLKTRAQWSMVVITKRAANTWLLTGDCVA